MLSLLHHTVHTVPPIFQKIRCFQNMAMQLNTLSSNCSYHGGLCVSNWLWMMRSVSRGLWWWSSLFCWCVTGSSRDGWALVVKHTHTPAGLCCPLLVICFTATLGLVFRATLLQGNYLQLAHQQQIWWVQPWWCRQMTGRCWCPGQLLAYRVRSRSQMLWFWKQGERVRFITDKQ